MDKKPSKFSFLNNNEEYACLPSSRMNKMRLSTNTFLQGGTSTFSTIRGPRNMSKNFMEPSEDGGNTQRRLNFTPVKRDANNESKQTLNVLMNPFGQPLFQNGNQMFGQPSNFLGLGGQTLQEDKENSNELSNKVKGVFSSQDSSNSKGDSSFKAPVRLSILNKLDDADKKNHLSSVRKNLQEIYAEKNSHPNNIFDDKNRNPKFLNNIISSSSSSAGSQGSSIISFSEINKEKEKESNQINVEALRKNLKEATPEALNSENRENNSNQSRENQLASSEEQNPYQVSQQTQQTQQTTQTQQTINDAFIDGFNNKTKIFIPQEKVNDEKFKLLMIKKVKRVQFKTNKTVSKTDTLPSQDDNENLTHYNFFNEKRKKLIHSVKRIYTSEIPFVDPISGNKKVFKIYKDSESGFSEVWQKYIRESHADEDVPSDEEILRRANDFVLKSLELGIALIKSGEKGQLNNLDNLD